MEKLIISTTKKEIAAGLLFFIIGILILIIGVIISDGNLFNLLIFIILGLSLPFFAVPSLHQFKYTGNNFIILSYDTPFFRKKVYVKDIIGASFVPLIWTPLMQSITKQEYSDKMMVFFCYKDSGKIKTQKILVYKKDALKIKKLIKEMNIKIIPATDFYRLGHYKCSKYLQRLDRQQWKGHK